MSLDSAPATDFAADALADLEPIQTDDLTTYLNGAAQIVQPVEDIVRPSATSPTPYGRALNIEETPDYLLPWLGQFVGVETTQGATAGFQRDEVRYLGGFKRGKVETLKAAVRATLTGKQTVVVYERDGGAYGMTVITYTAETPDPATTERVAIAAKAAGRFPFVYRTDPGWDIASMETAYAGLTITDLESDFASIGALESNSP